jgi:hypothetical protein
MCYANSAYQSEEAENVAFVSEHDEQPVKVITVPKTLKSPRIIAIEPVCMQYTQQAIRSVLYERIEAHKYTAGHVNFTSQRVNQNLALSSSSTGQYGTIDLSDASDRVLWSLAMTMFAGNRDLHDAVNACRSTRAKLPDGRIIGPLVKFASMGSALCFPVESMYFYTICVLARLRFHNLPVSHHSVQRVVDGLYVYGDDIVVPATEVETVLAYLEKYNCKVNIDKSFWTGKFRESCGVDAYDGQVVTPVYVRKLKPENRQQADRLISWVATANLFAKNGFARASEHMFCTCERILGRLPRVSERSPALGRISDHGLTVEKLSTKTQTPLVRGWVPVPVYRSDSVDGYSALQKCLLRLEHRSNDALEAEGPPGLLQRQKGYYVLPVDEQHLERTAQRGAVVLKRRGVPAT